MEYIATPTAQKMLDAAVVTKNHYKCYLTNLENSLSEQIKTFAFII
jgi:hypothetical protein